MTNDCDQFQSTVSFYERALLEPRLPLGPVTEVPPEWPASRALHYSMEAHHLSGQPSIAPADGRNDARMLVEHFLQGA